MVVAAEIIAVSSQTRHSLLVPATKCRPLWSKDIGLTLMSRSFFHNQSALLGP